MDGYINVLYDAGNSDPHIPENEAIVSLCERNFPEERVLPINKDVLVKYGNVSFEECHNQVEARRLLDPDIVRVPSVYRYFSKGAKNYLVMELIQGVERYTVEDDQSIVKIAQVIKHLQAISSNIPGPLGGGISRGLFWENEEIDLGSVVRLEEYMNRRMVGEQEGLKFRVKDLVLNHNDIAPRNIIWLSDGSICLLDWSSAGYYPRLLELAVLSFNTQQGKDLKFTMLLQQELGPVTREEENEVTLICMAWFNGHRKPLDDHIGCGLEGPSDARSPLREESLPHIIDAKMLSDRLWQEIQRTRMERYEE